MEVKTTTLEQQEIPSSLITTTKALEENLSHKVISGENFSKATESDTLPKTRMPDEVIDRIHGLGFELDEKYEIPELDDAYLTGDLVEFIAKLSNDDNEIPNFRLNIRDRNNDEVTPHYDITIHRGKQIGQKAEMIVPYVAEVNGEKFIGEVVIEIDFDGSIELKKKIILDTLYRYDALIGKYLPEWEGKTVYKV
ncbi:MAG: hypothetical protein LBO09_02940 [Candidatus Peribacteria bacterium]|jgi:hypothetical protein|nr:hypothetical protein [Candidatus Peribacteria bacterium]